MQHLYHAVPYGKNLPQTFQNTYTHVFTTVISVGYVWIVIGITLPGVYIGRQLCVIVSLEVYESEHQQHQTIFTVSIADLLNFRGFTS